jgi:hypothetical protein
MMDTFKSGDTWTGNNNNIANQSLMVPKASRYNNCYHPKKRIDRTQTKMQRFSGEDVTIFDHCRHRTRKSSASSFA